MSLCHETHWLRTFAPYSVKSQNKGTAIRTEAVNVARYNSESDQGCQAGNSLAKHQCPSPHAQGRREHILVVDEQQCRLSVAQPIVWADGYEVRGSEHSRCDVVPEENPGQTDW